MKYHAKAEITTKKMQIINRQYASLYNILMKNSDVGGFSS